MFTLGRARNVKAAMVCEFFPLIVRRNIEICTNMSSVKIRIFHSSRQQEGANFTGTFYILFRLSYFAKKETVASCTL